VREITLLGQNVNAYAHEGWTLARLIRALAGVPGLDRIRYTTSHPARHGRRPDRRARGGRGADALPAPAGAVGQRPGAQGHEPRAHGRQLPAHDRAVRAARPDIALSGDFIVGFPGETDADFEQTLQLVEAAGYASAFTFKYSRRPGTPAAAMLRQVAEPMKDERLQRLNALLDTQQRAFNAAQLGRTLPVLFERRGRNPGQILGKSPYLQSVHVTGPETLLGQIAPVTIGAAAKMSLTGDLADTAGAQDRAA
jgi:tRNA-2-methylthio-N6-dimethylallyladenosine synthase